MKNSNLRWIPLMTFASFLFFSCSEEKVPVSKSPKVEFVSLAPQTQSEVEGKIYQKADQMPSIEGCEVATEPGQMSSCTQKALLGYILDNFDYKNAAKDGNVAGRIITQLVISKEGVIQDIKILRGLTEDADREALRVLGSINQSTLQWIPGRMDGKPVNVQIVIPIRLEY